MLKLKANIIIYNIFKYCKSEYNVFQDVKLTTKKVKKYKNEVYMSVDVFHYEPKININYTKCSYKQKGFNDYKEEIFVNDLFKSVEINNLEDSFIICVLHEFGHVYRVLTSRANVGKYEKQIKNLKKWELSRPNNSKNRMKASKKYRAIEEEREADRFASKNYNTVKHILQPTIKLIEVLNEKENKIKILKNELFHEKSKNLDITNFEVKISKMGE